MMKRDLKMNTEEFNNPNYCQFYYVQIFKGKIEAMDRKDF